MHVLVVIGLVLAYLLVGVGVVRHVIRRQRVNVVEFFTPTGTSEDEQDLWILGVLVIILVVGWPGLFLVSAAAWAIRGLGRWGLKHGGR